MPVPEPSLKARLRDVLEGEAVRMMNGRDGTEHVCARFEEVVREAQRERDEEVGRLELDTGILPQQHGHAAMLA